MWITRDWSGKIGGYFFGFIHTGQKQNPVGSFLTAKWLSYEGLLLRSFVYSVLNFNADHRGPTQFFGWLGAGVWRWYPSKFWVSDDTSPRFWRWSIHICLLLSVKDQTGFAVLELMCVQFQLSYRCASSRGVTKQCPPPTMDDLYCQVPFSSEILKQNLIWKFNFFYEICNEFVGTKTSHLFWTAVDLWSSHSSWN